MRSAFVRSPNAARYRVDLARTLVIAGSGCAAVAPLALWSARALWRVCGWRGRIGRHVLVRTLSRLRRRPSRALHVRPVLGRLVPAPAGTPAGGAFAGTAG